MLYAIIFCIAAIFGILRGLKKNSRTLVIFSAIGLFLIVATWIYFYLNPY